MSGRIEAAFAPPVEARTGAAPGPDFDHGVWDGLLDAHLRHGDVPPNRLDYAGFSRADRAALTFYLHRMQAADLSGLGRDGQFAFWINLYNAQIVAVVLDRYPVGSIRDIALGGGLRARLAGGPWLAKLLTIAGHRLSLDDIENAILRPLFRDPRLHYALNCGSLGCPSLRPRAFTAARLEAELAEAARAFVNSPDGVDFNADGAVLSSIFKWYRRDFGGTEAAVLRHVAGQADPPLRQRLAAVRKVALYRYDWRLNDIAHRR